MKDACFRASRHASAGKRKKDTGHRVRVWRCAGGRISARWPQSESTAPVIICCLSKRRPYSDKYELLKPGGTIGLKLGILGTVLFFIIFLYALRKVIPWLGRIGTARHWMDFHVVAGVTAPIVIAFHASFKFSGIAGRRFLADAGWSR